MEYRIYVDGILRNICMKDYVFMSNLSNYREIYGRDRVKCESLPASLMDKEKIDWLNNIFGK